jgi:aryl-alcohol dehydrogenase-like predicted oxidoreductase
MRYRLLGRSGLRVSELCLGAMTFGTEWGWGADESVSRSQLDLFLERGGNFIDTANKYTEGSSERMLGELIQGRREQVVLATKYTLNMRPGDPNAGGNQRKNMVQSVEASLERLRTDYIDLYWVHVWDRVTPIEEVMRALDDLVRAGKILHVGVSDYPAWKIAQANTLAVLKDWTPFVALQIEYNLTLRDGERDLIPMAREMGIGVLPWSPLAGGVLTGKYSKDDMGPPPKSPEEWASEDGSRRNLVKGRITERNLAIADETVGVAKEIGCTPAQVALRWLLEKPGVTSPILGARTMDQLEDNLGCLDVELSGEHMARLDEVSAIELGFPHDFIRGPMVDELVFGGVPPEEVGEAG